MADRLGKSSSHGGPLRRALNAVLCITLGRLLKWVGIVVIVAVFLAVVGNVPRRRQRALSRQGFRPQLRGVLHRFKPEHCSARLFAPPASGRGGYPPSHFDDMKPDAVFRGTFD